MKKIRYHGQELLPIKSDIVFKVVFGKPENVDILAKFLEAILDLEIENPEDITLTNTELSGDYDGDKFSRFDNEQFLNRYRYLNTTDHEELSNLCEINFLELKKVPEKCYNDKEMWSLFIATNDEEVIDMLANKNQDIKKAVEKLEYDDEQISKATRLNIDDIKKLRKEQI